MWWLLKPVKISYLDSVISQARTAVIQTQTPLSLPEFPEFRWQMMNGSQVWCICVYLIYPSLPVFVPTSLALHFPLLSVLAQITLTTVWLLSNALSVLEWGCGAVLTAGMPPPPHPLVSPGVRHNPWLCGPWMVGGHYIPSHQIPPSIPLMTSPSLILCIVATVARLICGPVVTVYVSVYCKCFIFALTGQGGC